MLRPLILGKLSYIRRRYLLVPLFCFSDNFLYIIHMETIKRYQDTDYYVSREGKVFHNGKEVGYVHNGRVLVRFGKKGETKTRQRMMAETFCDYQEGQEVHHKNGITTDDRADNLVCLTPLQHQRLHNKSVITLMLDKDWNIVQAFNSLKEASQFVDCDDGTIKSAWEKGTLCREYHWICLYDLPKEFIFVSENVADLYYRLTQYVENEHCWGLWGETLREHNGDSKQSPNAFKGLLFK